MAQVFLSYDREDGPKARAIAQALETAGHFVWYDLHIKGGAEYGREIEAALKKSDAVVVLWSERSVQSAWVRDEAAAGRDKGGLVPVLIEPVTPPMGFRQYQNLDFSGWKGRGQLPRIEELVESIEAISGSSAERLLSAPSKPARSRRLFNIALPRWLIIGGGVVLILVSLSIVLSSKGSRGMYTVAVTAGDAAAAPLARDLRVKLSALPSAWYGSMRLLSKDDRSAAADLIFETESSGDRGRLGASLVLMAGKEREILWSKDFEQPSAKVADLKEQVGLSAARVLHCALRGLTYGPSPLARHTLKLWLDACAQPAEGPSRIRSLSQVTERAPSFAPAWDALLMEQAEAASLGNMGPASDPASLDALRQRIELARKLHPRLPALKIAQLSLLPADAHWERLHVVDEAKRENPDTPFVLAYRSYELFKVGRIAEGIEDSETAFKLDPVNPSAVSHYALALAYGGRTEAARQQLASEERLRPGSAVLRDLQYRFHLRFGDPKEALRLGQEFGIDRGTEIFLKARAEPSPANIEAVKKFALYRPRNNSDTLMLADTAQALGHFNLNDELYQIALHWQNSKGLAEHGELWFRPALRGFRQDSRFMLVMQKSGHLAYWRKSGKWPDFCFEPNLPYDCKAQAARLGS